MRVSYDFKIVVYISFFFAFGLAMQADDTPTSTSVDGNLAAGALVLAVAGAVGLTARQRLVNHRAQKKASKKMQKDENIEVWHS